MASTISTSTMTASAFWSDDKPIIIPRNMYGSLHSTVELRDAIPTGGTNYADNDYPGIHACDNYNNTQAKMSSNKAINSLYTALDTELTFDTFYVQCDTPTSTPSSVKLYADNTLFNNDTSVSSAFSRYLARIEQSGTLKSITTTDTTNIQVGVSFSGATEFIWRNVFLGKRIQLSMYPTFSVDTNMAASRTFDTTLSNGSMVRRIGCYGYREYSLLFKCGSSADADLLRRIWYESLFGNEIILFIEKPYTQPEKAGLYRIVNRELALPQTGPFERDLTLTLREQGGYPLAME